MKTGREQSFSKTIDLIKQYDSPINIVETGCVRGLSEDSRMGDGWSTYHWLKLCSETDSQLWSVDINSNAINQAKSLIDYFPKAKAIFVIDDSIRFLSNFD